MRARVPAVVLSLLLGATPLVGQGGPPPPSSILLLDSGARVSLGVNDDRGYRAFPLARLETAGWEISEDARSAVATGPDGVRVSFSVGSPFFRWGDRVLQLTDPPYRLGRQLHVPVQLLIDFLPREFPNRYAVDPESGQFEVRSAPTDFEPVGSRTANADPLQPLVPDTPVIPPRGRRPVVVIDAGHGGRDDGATGPGETREKDVALDIAELAASELRRRDAYDVYLTRADDELIELWERGEMATAWRADAPGVFLSIHANSSPDPEARGTETFFLAEARTEHAARVAALENEVLTRDLGPRDRPRDLDLAPLLSDLRNEDLQRWSAHLATLVQRAVAAVHPEPSRGVKQGPFAVLTNTLMPSALLEVGFLSNPEDEALLTNRTFQREVALAIADALDRFFQGYPPGSGGSGSGR